MVSEKQEKSSELDKYVRADSFSTSTVKLP